MDHEAEARRLKDEADREAKTLDVVTTGKDLSVPLAFALIASVLFFAYLYFSIVGQGELPSQVITKDTDSKDRFALRGQFGDQWGAFSSIITGLSFAFLALSLFLQRTELRMTRRELSMQRVELKYTRAQSHYQLHEWRMQREEQERRWIFQKEPIVMVSSVVLLPTKGGAEIHLRLDHFGPAACDLVIEAKFGDTDSFSLQAPQILSEDTKILHQMGEADFQKVSTLALNSEIGLSLDLKYRNLAGGCFLCNQEFRISEFAVKSALLRSDNEPRKFVPVTTTFSQAGAPPFGRKS